MSSKNIKIFNIIGFSTMSNPIVLYIVSHFLTLKAQENMSSLILRFNLDKVYIFLLISFVGFVVLERVIFSDTGISKALEKKSLKATEKKVEELMLSVILAKYLITSLGMNIYLFSGLFITVIKGDVFYGQPYFVMALLVSIESFIYFRKKLQKMENGEL